MKAPKTALLDADGLCAAHADEVWAAVCAISEDARREHGDSASSGVPFGDLVGIALLHRYMHIVCPDGRYDLVAEQYIDRALAAVHRLPLVPLYSGVVGVGWLLAHMARLDGGDADVSDLDEILLDKLGRPWTGSYDLVGGLVGVGCYALERMDEIGNELLALVVRHLSELAVDYGDATTWVTPPRLIPPTQRERYPDGYRNLGLAHGVPGVIRILSAAVAKDVESERAFALLGKSVPWLLANLRKNDDRWCLPTCVESTGPFVSRLAWCYNELGAMTAVVAAGRACDRSDWLSTATGVLLSTVGLPQQASGCRDASLCHGAAGVAHIYQTVSMELGNAVLAREANRWFNIVLEMRREQSGSGGFLYYTLSPGKQEAAYKPNHSFLEGATGIGLACLASTWNIDTGWNRLLALS